MTKPLSYLVRIELPCRCIFSVEFDQDKKYRMSAGTSQCAEHLTTLRSYELQMRFQVAITYAADQIGGSWEPCETGSPEIHGICGECGRAN